MNIKKAIRKYEKKILVELEAINQFKFVEQHELAHAKVQKIEIYEKFVKILKKAK